jgi:alginate O-acetyltransferase complex protein AlgJ
VKAIAAFHEQLSARGIDLIVVPVPMKPGVEARHLSTRAQSNQILQNQSFADFKSRLDKAGIRVFDPATLEAPRYLETDTHWRPETMESVAQKLAAKIKEPAAAATLQVTDRTINGTGDIARMLKLPESTNPYPTESVTIHEVASWHPSKEADILLLGDSFSNIFSLEALGWGESAGFAEQLSRALGGRALDCILRNSDGAFATREILSRELARGRDRLAGKKLVIWEFAARELAFGDWKMIEMKVGQPAPAKFFLPKTGETVTASGTVEAISTVPRPGSVPYKDHILAVHLTDLTIEGREENAALEAVVYAESMRDNVLTSAARLRPGDRITLHLRPWSDVSDRYEKINRSEIDDPAIQLEEPCWGEIVK